MHPLMRHQHHIVLLSMRIQRMADGPKLIVQIARCRALLLLLTALLHAGVALHIHAGHHSIRAILSPPQMLVRFVQAALIALVGRFVRPHKRDARIEIPTDQSTHLRIEAGDTVPLDAVRIEGARSKQIRCVHVAPHVQRSAAHIQALVAKQLCEHRQRRIVEQAQPLAVLIVERVDAQLVGRAQLNHHHVPVSVDECAA